MTKAKGGAARALRKAYIFLIMAFLYAPIVMLILYSFNDSKSRAKWGGFTLRWYRELFADTEVMTALKNTLVLAVASALISTVIGLAILARGRRSQARRKSMPIPPAQLTVATPSSSESRFISFSAFTTE